MVVSHTLKPYKACTHTHTHVYLSRQISSPIPLPFLTSFPLPFLSQFTLPPFLILLPPCLTSPNPHFFSVSLPSTPPLRPLPPSSPTLSAHPLSSACLFIALHFPLSYLSSLPLPTPSTPSPTPSKHNWTSDGRLDAGQMQAIAEVPLLARRAVEMPDKIPEGITIEDVSIRNVSLV